MFSGEPLYNRLNFIEPVDVESVSEFQDGGSVEIYLIDAEGHYVVLWFDFGITSLPRGRLALRNKQENIFYPVAQESPLQIQLEKYLLEWRVKPLFVPDSTDEILPGEYVERVIGRCLEGLDNIRKLSRWGGGVRSKPRPYITRFPSVRVSK